MICAKVLDLKVVKAADGDAGKAEVDAWSGCDAELGVAVGGKVNSGAFTVGTFAHE